MITTASLFNLAGPDLIIIFFVILLLFGAKKLPELARGLGQAFKEFAKAKDEFEHEITRTPQTAPPVAPLPPTQPVETSASVVKEEKKEAQPQAGSTQRA
jgi:sec-independent protein translocase protein TatA